MFCRLWFIFYFGGRFVLDFYRYFFSNILGYINYWGVKGVVFFDERKYFL